MKIGVIGFGTRISGFLNSLIEFKTEIEFNVTAITDTSPEEVKNKLLKMNIDFQNINFYIDADQMLEKEELDGVIIGTRCSLHAKMANKVLNKNLPLFLEKPVATSMENLITLKNISEHSKSQVVVSFPLKVSEMVHLAKEIIQTGKIGSVEHVQAINNVPYGGVYYHNWYRDENEIKGLFVQKATHDFDYINYLLDKTPIMVCAMRSKQIFKGDKPAGLLCKDCFEKETCPEGPFLMKHFKYDSACGDMCCFAEDTGNEDSGSAIIRYDSGLHVSYSQNFFARHAAAARGARLLGYKGTLDFDWYRDELIIHMHNTPRTETYKFDTSKVQHFGGDKILAYNFLRVMQGKEKSISPLDDGLLSSLMCLKAQKSSETNTFQKIEWEL